MTERELFEQSIPMIAEMIVIVSGLTDEEYQEWLDEVEAAILKSPRARRFAFKVLCIVDKYRQQEVKNGST